jgi:hypothetical protein
LRFESIREFEVAIDFGTIKTDKHTGRIPAGSLGASPIQASPVRKRTNVLN